VQKLRKLGKRDRPPVVKAAGRMASTQKLCDRRDRLQISGGDLAQINPLSRPSGAQGRQWRNHSDIRIGSAQRIGVPTFRAARVEEEVVKVPKNEAVIAFAQSKLTFAGSADLEEDLAIEEQGEKLDSWKTLLPTQPFDLLRGREHGDGGRNLRIANSEERAGARRFQNHVCAAPSHVREPGEDKSVAAELGRLRPIFGNLRLDNDQGLAIARAREAIFQ
jgi:hypothetical protein